MDTQQRDCGSVHSSITDCGRDVLEYVICVRDNRPKHKSKHKWRQLKQRSLRHRRRVRWFASSIWRRNWSWQVVDFGPGGKMSVLRNEYHNCPLICGILYLKYNF